MESYHAWKVNDLKELLLQYDLYPKKGSGKNGNIIKMDLIKAVEQIDFHQENQLPQEMKLPQEIIEEIYSHLGNTDKRRLIQTNKQFKPILEKNKFSNYYLEEYSQDRYPIPQKYISFENIELFIATNNLEIIKKIKMNKDEQLTFCKLAAQYGKLNLLKYAYENHFKWNLLTCSSAAENGHLDCLKYAHENGCPWDDATCFGSAARGHLDCLTYAHEHKCPWDDTVCVIAAGHGHLDCLKYAHKHKCPWDRMTCGYAAAYGHLACLKYAHENGCPWDEATCEWAARNGHLDCLKYAIQHKCPGYEKYL